jgi:hypothetical protein
MLAKAESQGLVKGVLCREGGRGIISLQYADDTLLFSSANFDNLVNLKCVLLSFEQISGMRINFHKS